MSQKLILTAVIAVIVGVIIGSVIDGDEEHHHEEEDHSEHVMHAHEQREAEAPVPGVALTVHEDAKSGWNAQIAVTNFVLVPERVSGEHVAGEGHAHIYVDGEKINRVYGEWYHLGEESMRAFGIGYAPKAWDLVQQWLRKQKFTPAEMVERCG